MCVCAAREMAETKGDTRALLRIMNEIAKKQQATGRTWWGGKPEPVAAPRAAGEGGGGGAEHKFVATTLVTGASNVAARGLQAALGLDDDVVLAGYMLDPMSAMTMEVMENGSENDCDNLFYILHGEAGNSTHLPAQVKRDIASGTYHDGTLEEGNYDRWHTGWKLTDFVNHETSKLAGLKTHHVLALRLYTSSSYRKFNGPLRTGETPHPWRFTVYVLGEALKKLRVVDATLHGEDFNKVCVLASLCVVQRDSRTPRPTEYIYQVKNVGIYEAKSTGNARKVQDQELACALR